MPRSLFLINVILFTIIGLLGIKLYNTWNHSLEVPAISAQEKPKAGKKRTISKREHILNETSYQIIVDKDLFRPSRTPIKENAQTATPLSPKDRPKLFGTMIMDSRKFAILEDPSTKASKIYYINDSFSGFTVSEILEDKVILKRGGESFEVKLREKKDIKLPKPPKKAPKKRTPPRRTRPRRTFKKPGENKSGNAAD